VAGPKEFPSPLCQRLLQVHPGVRRVARLRPAPAPWWPWRHGRLPGMRSPPAAPVSGPAPGGLAGQCPGCREQQRRRVVRLRRRPEVHCQWKHARRGLASGLHLRPLPDESGKPGIQRWTVSRPVTGLAVWPPPTGRLPSAAARRFPSEGSVATLPWFHVWGPLIGRRPVKSVHSVEPEQLRLAVARQLQPPPRSLLLEADRCRPASRQRRLLRSAAAAGKQPPPAAAGRLSPLL